MSALTDKLHALFTKFTGEGQLIEHEVEDAVKAVAEHLMPVADAIKADIVAAINEAVEQFKADVEKLAAEIKAEINSAAAPQDASVTEAPAGATQAEPSSPPVA